MVYFLVLVLVLVLFFFLSPSLFFSLFDHKFQLFLVNNYFLSWVETYLSSRKRNIYIPKITPLSSEKGVWNKKYLFLVLYHN